MTPALKYTYIAQTVFAVVGMAVFLIPNPYSVFGAIAFGIGVVAMLVTAIVTRGRE